MTTLDLRSRIVESRQVPLAVMVGAMTALALVCAVGLLVDDRTVLGVPVWLKPLKFAVSFALYGATLAWMLTLPHRGSRWTRAMATVFAVTGIIDVGFIAVQAARGTFSHFNTSDDAVNTIGQYVFITGVPGLFVANLVIALILLFQRVGDRPLTRAIHAGLFLAVAGMALGYLMGFQGRQTTTDASGRVVELAARHSVGVTDENPGLPVTNWSTSGGDLRIPHFVGLHGLQAMLLGALVLSVLASRIPWLRSEGTRASLMAVLALAYTGLLAVLTWQAFRGQPLIHPDALTLAALGGLLAATALAVRAVRSRAEAGQQAGPA